MSEQELITRIYPHIVKLKQLWEEVEKIASNKKPLTITDTKGE